MKRASGVRDGEQGEERGEGLNEAAIEGPSPWCLTCTPAAKFPYLFSNQDPNLVSDSVGMWGILSPSEFLCEGSISSPNFSKKCSNQVDTSLSYISPDTSKNAP